MSGPKRGTWRLTRVNRRSTYESTQKQLADLTRFRKKLDNWLTCQAPFLREHLGEEAVSKGQEAIDRVSAYIKDGSPNSGFGAYGRAWRSFNELWREAARARDRKRCEHRRCQREQRQQLEARAAAALQACRTSWDDHEHRKLLARWAPTQQVNSLAQELSSLERGKPQSRLENTEAWQRRFEQLLDAAKQQSAENTERVASLLPRLHDGFDKLSLCDVSCLSEDRQMAISASTEVLQREARAATDAEEAGRIDDLCRRVEGLRAEAEGENRTAQLRLVADRWHGVLAGLGYSVVPVKERPGGTLVLEASSFPMRSVSIALQPGSDEVHLNVNGAHDSVQCVKDMTAIQEALAQQGIEFTMTDWGRGRPDTRVVRQQHEQVGAR